MEFTHTHTFSASVDAVVQMLASEDFAHARAGAGGGEGGEAWVDGSAETAFTVSVRRVVPASSIPREFRSFVGGDLHVRYTEAWQAPDGDERVGTFAVEILGAPGHAAGALALTGAGASTVLVAKGDVKVQIPLIGGMVEKAVTDAVIKGLDLELSEADAWLAR